jgi:hypothetical protein
MNEQIKRKPGRPAGTIGIKHTKSGAGRPAGTIGIKHTKSGAGRPVSTKKSVGNKKITIYVNDIYYDKLKDAVKNTDLSLSSFINEALKLATKNKKFNKLLTNTK